MTTGKAVSKTATGPGARPVSPAIAAGAEAGMRAKTKFARMLVRVVASARLFALRAEKIAYERMQCGVGWT